MCICVWGGMCTQEYRCLQWSEEGTGSYGAGATGSSELPDVVLGNKRHPLEKQQALFTDEAVHKQRWAFSVPSPSAVDICHPATICQLSL